VKTVDEQTAAQAREAVQRSLDWQDRSAAEAARAGDEVD
jgi:hypothetical protein